MTWTYYKETLPDGRWLLYRAASGRKSESYFVRSGWNESDLLFHRRSKGDIDSSDIISEEEAERLIARLQDPQETTPDEPMRSCGESGPGSRATERRSRPGKQAMAWTYYKETMASGRWLLFRRANGHKDESYNRQVGWVESELLLRRLSKGDIDATDIIPEEKARELVEGISGAT